MAAELWHNLRIEQCFALSGSANLKSTDLLTLKNTDVLAREWLARRSLNTEPLRQLLENYIDEEQVRHSKVAFGLTTIRMNEWKPQSLWLEEIPRGRLIDFIMASARLPGKQPGQIDGSRYLDGGFAEIVPLSMLRRRGLRRLVAIDIDSRSLHWTVDDNTQLALIHNRVGLGGLLDMDQARIRRNEELDTWTRLRPLTG